MLTMCPAHGCPHRQRCYRHRAIPERLQSYFSLPPWVEDRCEKFLPIYPTDAVRVTTTTKEINP